MIIIKRLTPEERRMILLILSVRRLLRSNYTVMFGNQDLKMTKERRRQLRAETGKEALDFVATLQTLLLFMTEEEKCDYLDGLKHIVTG